MFTCTGAGLATTVCEAAEDMGGRVRTDRRDGFLPDRGFQVLPPTYLELRHQAGLSALTPHSRPIPGRAGLRTHVRFIEATDTRPDKRPGCRAMVCGR